MANIQHSSLTDPNIHEPKGISTASANSSYMSNGSGTGTWTLVNRFPGTGWGKYTNATYVGTTALAVGSTNTQIVFDTNADVSQLPISLAGVTSSLMNLTTDTLLFVSTGDLHNITATATVYSVVSTPNFIDLELYGSSDGTTYGTLLGSKTIPLIKGAGQVITESAQFQVTADMVTHGARMYFRTNSGTANLINIGLISSRVHKAR
jgi:hypothetical protein